MRINMPFNFHHDQRRYPIRRNEDGQSLRQRCFALFKQGKSAKEAVVILHMKLATARKYYSQWNECPPALQETYRFVKQDLKKKGDLSPRIIGMISKALGIPEWEAIKMVSRPYGLKQLIMGDLIRKRKKMSYRTQEQRLEAALSLVVLYEKMGIPMEWITREVNKLMQRARKYKEIRSVDAGQNIEIDKNLTED
jgi:hypothetical protein